MLDIWQISVIAALTMSSSAVVYVGSATIAATDFALQSDASDTPSRSVSSPDNAVRLKRGPDGLFHIRVHFDGVPASAILDTGASRSVIGKATLDRLGRRSGPDFQSKRGGVMLTLSGNVNYRLVPVDEIRVEGFNLGNLEAAAIDSPNVPTVLGQDAISRFHSVTIEGSELILR